MVKLARHEEFISAVVLKSVDTSPWSEIQDLSTLDDSNSLLLASLHSAATVIGICCLNSLLFFSNREGVQLPYCDSPQ